jgi:hypothetical protein
LPTYNSMVIYAYIAAMIMIASPFEAQLPTDAPINPSHIASWSCEVCPSCHHTSQAYRVKCTHWIHNDHKCSSQFYSSHMCPLCTHPSHTHWASASVATPLSQICLANVPHLVHPTIMSPTEHMPKSSKLIDHFVHHMSWMPKGKVSCDNLFYPPSLLWVYPHHMK